MPKNCFSLMSTPATIRDLITRADVVIGAILVRALKHPNWSQGDAKTMKRGAVLVDVSIDQGGCFETSHETTHSNPIYTVDGVVHYCVANMPGRPQNIYYGPDECHSTYAVEIANKGWAEAMKENLEIRLGANIVKGK